MLSLLGTLNLLDDCYISNNVCNVQHSSSILNVVKTEYSPTDWFMIFCPVIMVIYFAAHVAENKRKSQKKIKQSDTKVEEVNKSDMNTLFDLCNKLFGKCGTNKLLVDMQKREITVQQYNYENVTITPPSSSNNVNCTTKENVVSLPPSPRIKKPLLMSTFRDRKIAQLKRKPVCRSNSHETTSSSSSSSSESNSSSSRSRSYSDEESSSKDTTTTSRSTTTTTSSSSEDLDPQMVKQIRNMFERKGIPQFKFEIQNKDEIDEEVCLSTTDSGNSSSSSDTLPPLLDAPNDE